jgi:homoserine dehydrogenase
VRVALIGYGSVARAFVSLITERRKRFPFRIAGVHTLRHGTAYGGSPLEFGPAAGRVGEFLETAQAEVLVELSSLEPETGEPALTHIREAFARGMHVVTANKGPIAHAYGALRAEAAERGVQFRFESTVMDGAPVFNMVRNCLPGVRILGFSGALNSTTKIILQAMAQERTFAEGVAEARELGITEADTSDDIDGWDSAVKAAALANVLMDAGVRPQDVEREGIGSLTAEHVVAAREAGEVFVLISRAETLPDGRVRMRVRPERLPRTDPLSTSCGTSNLLLLHTDLMGTVGTISIEPGVEQTAYGLLSDLVDITRTL